MSAKHAREHEAKFQVAPDTHPTLFSQQISIAGYTSEAQGTVAQSDTYLDTCAYDLLRHGIALRVRQKGAAYEAGIKSIQATRKGVIQTRTDIAIPLPRQADPFDAPTWPATAQELLTPYAVKLDELRPLVSVRQHRQKTTLRAATSATRLAEWSLDEVWIGTRSDEIKTSNRAGAGISHHQTHFYELEIEQLPAENDTDAAQDREVAFASLVDHVQKLLDLKPSYASKLVRGLEIALAQAHENATALTPTMTLEAAGRLLLHQQLFQIMLNEHGVRYSKDARYVHDMRVAIRRARAAIQLCASAIPDKTLTPHTRALRRLGRALGTVRDLDVALANLRDFRRNQPESQHKGIKLLRRELKSQRARAHADLLALLDSKKHRKFILDFAEFCVTPATAEAEAASSPYAIVPSQVRHLVPSRILAAFESVRAYETAFSSSDLPPLETFHALRKQTKYLRYLLEFSQHLLGEQGEKLIEQLRTLQEHLGALNDAHVEQIRLEQWAETLRSDNPLCEAVEARRAQVNAHIHELAASAPSHLANFVSSANRQTFALAIASI